MNSNYSTIRVFAVVALLSVASAALSQSPDSAPPREPAMALLDSPRHQEWVRIPQGDREVHAFLVYPERADKAISVVVIHENRGLNDWVRSVADELARAGYIAIAPDLLSGMGPDGGKTADFADSDAAREAIYALDPDQVTADLKAVAEFVKSLPAANGEVTVGGFCWGGAQTFRFATNYQDLDAAFVFYGSSPAEGFDRITAAVYGFYGGNDERVNATIDPASKTMSELGKKFEPVIYDGAGHGFMRRGQEEGASEADSTSMRQAWKRWRELLGDR